MSSAGGRLRSRRPTGAGRAVAGGNAGERGVVVSRPLRSRLMTLSAVTSSEVRFWPSLPSYSRVLKRPSTKTRLPLRSCSATRSARSPKMLTRYQSVPSSTQPPWPSGLLLADRDGELGHGPAAGHVAHLRVAAQVADEHDLAERHRQASVNRWRPGPPRSRIRRSARERPRPLPPRPTGREHRLVVDVDVVVGVVGAARLGRAVGAGHEMAEDLLGDEEAVLQLRDRLGGASKRTMWYDPSRWRSMG